LSSGLCVSLLNPLFLKNPVTLLIIPFPGADFLIRSEEKGISPGFEAASHYGPVRLAQSVTSLLILLAAVRRQLIFKSTVT